MIDYMPALNKRTKSPEIVLEGKDNTIAINIAIKKEPSKKR
jgi:hypothetical protein